MSLVLVENNRILYWQKSMADATLVRKRQNVAVLHPVGSAAGTLGQDANYMHRTLRHIKLMPSN
jgi:hypothetical protein